MSDDKVFTEDEESAKRNGREGDPLSFKLADGETERDIKPENKDSGVPKDVHIDLPFPFLVATFDGRYAVVSRVIDNQFADIGIVDMAVPPGHEFFGKPVASVRIAFGPTPLNTEVSAYWTEAIGTTANSLYTSFCQRIAQTLVTPKKPALVRLNGGLG